MAGDALWPVHRQSMRLREVTAYLSTYANHTTAFEALILRFVTDPADIDLDEPEGPTAATVAIVTDNMDDTVRVCEAADWQPDHELVRVPMTDQEPWCSVLGKPLMWSWTMTNQQGYRDGCQLMFAENVADTEIVIQLLNDGRIQVRTFDKQFLPPPVPPG